MMKVKVQFPAEWLRYCIIGNSTLRLLQYHCLVILKKRQVEFYSKVSKQRCSAEPLQVCCGSFIAGVLQVAAGGYHY